MTYGYICTNYNNSRFTREAVLSLAARNRFYSVVVDNASRHESVAELQDFAAGRPDVELLLNDANLGYFRGLNAGIRRLREVRPDIDTMVIGNNDLVFPPDFADELDRNSDTFQQHAVVSPNITTLDGEPQNPHVIHGVSKMRELVYDLYFANYTLARMIRWAAGATRRFTRRADEFQNEIARPIYQGHGSCYILTPVFFRHFAELWAPTFLMGEEFFLSKQLSDKGMQVYYEPSIHLQHHCHASIASLPSRKMWEIAREAHREYRKYVKIFR